MELQPKAGQEQCPLCRLAVKRSGESLFECSGCRTAYHLECAREMAGCGTLGCVWGGVRPPGLHPQLLEEAARAQRELEEEDEADRKRAQAEVVNRGEAANLELAMLVLVVFVVLAAVVLGTWFVGCQSPSR